MGVTYKEHLIEPVVEITVNGVVTEKDMDDMIPQLEEFILRHGKIRLLEIVKEFDGFEVSLIWTRMSFNLEHLSQITHVALVSDIGWLTPVTKAAAAISSVQLRSFQMDELEAARAWLSHPEAV